MARRTEPVKSEFSEKVAKFFREKRIAMGLTQSDVALLIYGTKDRRNVISDIENNMKQMNCHDIDRFCKQFNCDVDFKEQNL